MADQNNTASKRSKTSGVIESVTITTSQPNTKDGPKSTSKTIVAATGNEQANSRLHRSSYDEEADQTFWGRTQKSYAKSPFFPLGLASFFGIAGYAGVKYYRNRNEFRNNPMAKTLFWTKFRVYAQGAAVGIIMIGFFDDLYLRYGKPAAVAPPPTVATTDVKREGR